jgi:hypothetical protein
MSFVSEATRWTPDRAAWEEIKSASLESPAGLEVRGLRSREDPAPGRLIGRARFSTSKDPVGAPIFFRAVPTPFPDVVDYVKVKWKLGWLSSYDPPVTVMRNQQICFNCHAASYDGKAFGLEFNPRDDQGDRTAYMFFRDPGRTVRLRWRDYFDWNSYLPQTQRGGEYATFSTISPDGRFVVAGGLSLLNVTIVPCRDLVSYSNTTKSILLSYSASERKIRPLPGADDPGRIHVPGSWSPDGRYVYFFGAPVSPQIDKLNREPLDEKALEEYRQMEAHALDRIFPVKYDVFRIPFADGRGGTAIPVPGASRNGRSNTLPRVSPDGRWLVFTQSANGFMTLRRDADLYIVPSEGGKARRLRANSPACESWHTWSPNSRWLAFVSKRNGPRTDLYLTHIDEKGHDSPPILLSHLRDEDGLAANLPEFFNIQPGRFEALEPRLSDWGYRVRLFWDRWWPW